MKVGVHPSIRSAVWAWLCGRLDVTRVGASSNGATSNLPPTQQGSTTYDITGSYNTTTTTNTTNTNAALAAQNSPYLVNPTGTGQQGSPILTTNPGYTGPTYPASGIAASGMAGSQYSPYGNAATTAPKGSATAASNAAPHPPAIQTPAPKPGPY